MGIWGFIGGIHRYIGVYIQVHRASYKGPIGYIRVCVLRVYGGLWGYKGLYIRGLMDI